MFLLDLGSHTLKIGTFQENDDTQSNGSDESLFHISHMSAVTTRNSAKLECDEIPTLKGWPKITSLNQMYLNSAQIADRVRYGLDCLLQSDFLSLHPIIASQGSIQDWD